MKILVVNDDSIADPGIAVLAKAAACLGEVVVAAPAAQCSAMSQKLTLRERISVEQVFDFPAEVSSAWRIGGTPVDCVRVALDYILKEKPDFVFSGINSGYNAGRDMSYSGTVAAALEGVRQGIPAIAFSAARDASLEMLEPHLLSLIRELVAEDCGPGLIWNVNFPSLNKRPLSGILRDRVPASVGMYRDWYEPHIQPDGSVLLECRGVPIPDEAFHDGTDAAAVRAGYISIGRVRDIGL